MLYPFPALYPALFEERLNRFAARARLSPSGEEILLHVPNSGRMKELLLPGTPVWYAPRHGEGKTRGTLWLAQAPGALVAVHSLLANWAAGAALEKGLIGELSEYKVAKREAKKGQSRFDFLLTHGKSGEALWLEVKSVNLVQEGRGLFPDAPTERGVRHLEELTAFSRSGIKTGVLFMHLRKDAREFAPYTAIHPDFTRALKNAIQSGVGCWAYALEISREGVLALDYVALGKEW